MFPSLPTDRMIPVTLTRRNNYFHASQQDFVVSQKSTGSSCTPESDMSRFGNFVSPPIHVDRLWSLPQPLRCNFSRFFNWPNDSGNLDKEEQPLAMKSTRLWRFPKSSGSSCTPQSYMSRFGNFVNPPISTNIFHWNVEDFVVCQNPLEVLAHLISICLDLSNSWAHQ